jgi:hypothetical protein
VDDVEALRAEMGAAMAGADGALATADRLCHAFVQLLEVDGSAVGAA